MSNARRAYWPLVFATSLVYAAMLLWTGPKLMAEAGGLMPFDLRMTGYSLEDTRTYLAALSPRGTAIYLGPAMRLDTFFPGMFTLVLVWGSWMLTRQRPMVLRLAVVLSGVIYGVFDYLENASVAKILMSGIDGLSPALVASASRYTMLKFVFVDIAILFLIAFAIARSRAKRQKKNAT